MTPLAASTSSYFVGVTVLSVGLLVGSSIVLWRVMWHRYVMHWHANKLVEQLEGAERPAIVRAEGLRLLGEVPGEPDIAPDAQLKWVKEADAFEQRLATLAGAHDRVLRLSIDELVYVNYTVEHEARQLIAAFDENRSLASKVLAVREQLPRELQPGDTD